MNKTFLPLGCLAFLTLAPTPSPAQDFLGNLARRAAEQLAERAAAAAVAGVVAPRSSQPAQTDATRRGSTTGRRDHGGIDAWLSAQPPEPAPGFVLAGTSFIYQDTVNDRDDEFNPDGNSWPGWGESEARAVGERLKLPEGLELIGPFKNYNASNPEDCDRKYENEAVGVGEDVQICLVLRNTTSGPLRFELPPGMMFESRSRGVQNGVLMHRVSFEVPAGTVYFQPLFLHCANSGFSPSSQEEEGYDIGPIQTQRPVREAIALIETKQVDRWYYPIVSQAVTDLGDAGRLSNATRRGLNALPQRR